jgi:ribosomal protein S18 acetylase RimI-like enzyme
MSVTLADRAHANMVEAFASLPAHQDGGFVRRGTGVVIAATGSPIALFNEILPVGARVSPDTLVDAVQVLRDAGLTAFVQVRDGLDQLGLDEVSAASWPAMVLTDLPSTLEAPGGLEVRRTADPDTLADHLRATGGDPERTATWLGRGILDDPAWSLFVGYLDGHPVARSMGFCHDGMVGVYNVGTRESARRRGYGWALTEAVLVSGAEAGCTVATLQSSAMAQPMYEAHGFRALFRYRAFHLAAPPS